MKLYKHKKSQTIFVAIMISVMVFILVVVMSYPLKEEITKSMNGSSLNCTGNPEITKFNKATCNILDMSLFYFLGSLIAIGIAFVSGKRNITGAMTAIMVFVVTIILITPLKDLIILVRDASHLDCTSTSITVGANLSCIIVDLWLFYFIATCIAAGITYIFVTKVMPKK